LFSVASVNVGLAVAFIRALHFESCLPRRVSSKCELRIRA
jgi:hypothetical protein